VPLFRQTALQVYLIGELHLIIDTYATHQRGGVGVKPPGTARQAFTSGPDVRILADPRRGLVRHHRPAGPPPHTSGSVEDLNAKVAP